MSNKITKVSKNSQQNNSDRVSNEHDKEMPKERYISRTKTRNYCELRLKQYNKGISKNYKKIIQRQLTMIKKCKRYMSPEKRQKIIDNLRSIILV